MTLRPEIWNAILSMDAYNRGYDASITLPTIPNATQIGNSTILLDSRIFQNGTGRLDDDIGFYALAYDTNGDGKADVISYRGTDYPQTDKLGTKDIGNGWTLGAGLTSSEQGIMAVDFYKTVVGGNFYTSNITLAGHSLGGGLAGLVEANDNAQKARKVS